MRKNSANNISGSPLFCPAKINLGLKVHHKRIEDGYHYISSIFVPISFGDTMVFEKSEEHRLVSKNNLPPSSYGDFDAVSERGDFSRNLLSKVLQELKDCISEGVTIHLEKNIPSGAGLGGGSSDAAGLLRYLQKEFSIDETRIFQTARKLGADIPFFLTPGPKLVTGIGDIFQNIRLGEAHGVLVIPDKTVSTVTAYRALKRTLQPDPPPKNLSGLTEIILDGLAESRWEMAGKLTNDFEEVVFKEHPEFVGIKDAMLEKGAEYASLSGSGSAVYSLFREEKLQHSIMENLKKLYPQYSCRPFRILNET